MQKEHLRKTRREGRRGKRREKGRKGKRMGRREEEINVCKIATVFGIRDIFFFYYKK